MRNIFLKKIIKKLLLILLVLNLFLIYLIYKTSENTFNFILDEISDAEDTSLPYICNNTISNYKIDTNLDFILNPKDSLCEPSSNKNLLLICFVIIAPNYFEKRTLIRNTWGQKKFSQDMKLIFALGKSENETINRMIVEESDRNQDIIQKNFIDSYYNLTTKIMMSLNWISKHCSNSKYILRINDDVIVNTFSLIKYLKQIDYKKNQIFGVVRRNTPVDRDPESKFYVSSKEYNKAYYALYPEGSAYVLTTDLAFTYYNKSVNTYCPPFSVWLEDVFIGMLASNFETTINDLTAYYVPDNPYTPFNQPGKKEKLKLLLKNTVERTLFIYEKDEFAYFWNILNKEIENEVKKTM